MHKTRLRNVKKSRPCGAGQSIVRLIFAVLLFGLCGGGIAQESFEVEIRRTYESSTCATGELFVNGEFVAYTLEPPWAGNKRYISSIPSGTYSGIVRYDKTDRYSAKTFENRWRIELTGVPGRDNIQIHVGNYPRDTTGCALVGTILDNGKCRTRNSRSAFARLKNAFYGSPNPVLSPNKNVRVTIRHYLNSSESTEFHYSGGVIKMYGREWREFRGGELFATYKEVHRNLNHIKLEASGGTKLWLPLGYDAFSNTIYKRTNSSNERTPYKVAKRKY